MVVGEVVVGEAVGEERSSVLVSDTSVQRSLIYSGSQTQAPPFALKIVTDSDRVHVQRRETDFQVRVAPFPS